MSKWKAYVDGREIGIGDTIYAAQTDVPYILMSIHDDGTLDVISSCVGVGTVRNVSHLKFQCVQLKKCSDIGLSWSAVLPILLEAAKNGSSDAIKELTRMAEIADRCKNV